MVSYIVTGGSEFLRGRVVRYLLDGDRSAVVHETLDGVDGTRLRALPSGITVPRHEIPHVDHLVHLGPARFPDTADLGELRAALRLAARLGTTFGYLSSVAVAGAHRGRFFEDDFDIGQPLTCAAHRMAFAAEDLIRRTRDVRWRIFRAGHLTGDSRTGELDRTGALAPFLPLVERLTGLPADLPVPLPDWGTTNAVPADYVAAALAELLRGPNGYGRAYHLVNPARQGFGELYCALAGAAGGPRAVPLPGSGLLLDRLARLPGYPAVRDRILDAVGLPAHAPDRVRVTAEFIDDTTRARLRGTGIAVPAFDSYADRIWTYWRDHLAPRALTAPAALPKQVLRAAPRPARELVDA